MDYYLSGDLRSVDLDLFSALEKVLSYIIVKQKEDIEALERKSGASTGVPEESVELSVKKKLKMELTRLLSFGVLMNGNVELSASTRQGTHSALSQTMSILKTLFGLAANGQEFAWEVINKKTLKWRGSHLSFPEIEALVKKGIDLRDPRSFMNAANAIAAKDLRGAEMTEALDLLSELLTGVAGEEVDLRKINRLCASLPIESNSVGLEIKRVRGPDGYVRQGVRVLPSLLRSFGQEPEKDKPEFQYRLEMVEFLKGHLDELLVKESDAAEVFTFISKRLTAFTAALRDSYQVQSEDESLRGSRASTSRVSLFDSVSEASGAIIGSLRNVERSSGADMTKLLFGSREERALVESTTLSGEKAEEITSKLNQHVQKLTKANKIAYFDSLDLVSLHLEATIAVLLFSNDLKRNGVHIEFLKSTFKILKSLQSDPPSSLDSVLSESELPSTDLLSLTNQLLETVSSPKFRISPSSRALLKRWVLTLVADSTAPREALELGVELGCRVFSMEPSAGSRPTPVESSVLEGLKWVSTLLHNAKIEVLQDAAMAVSRADECSLPKMGRVLAALLSRPEFRALAGRLSLEGVEEAAQQMERLAAIGNFKKMKGNVSRFIKLLSGSLMEVQKRRIGRD